MYVALVVGVLALPWLLDSMWRAGVPVPHGFWCIHHHGGGGITACKSNLKNIGTALEMYSTDSAGRLPRHLSQLTPNYLKNIPTCPSLGANTYSSGFVSASGPDAYTVVCSGSNHAGVGLSPNFPQYNSTQGLIER